MNVPQSHDQRRRRNVVRRGFNLVELLMALAISATLLAATMVALTASFSAYQRTTEVASTHTISRLAIHRMLTLVRTGTNFRPLPADPRDRIVQSNFIDFELSDGTIMSFEWDDADEALYVVVGGAGGPRYLLIEGVQEQLDQDGDPIPPFTLEYENGFTLYRATIDLAIVPDDNLDVDLDGENVEVIRLVASAMPRAVAYE
jgi:prepilin-type N-terminal cleavage/methylation domain-containing protein